MTISVFVDTSASTCLIEFERQLCDKLNNNNILLEVMYIVRYYTIHDPLMKWNTNMFETCVFTEMHGTRFFAIKSNHIKSFVMI